MHAIETESGLKPEPQLSLYCEQQLVDGGQPEPGASCCPPHAIKIMAKGMLLILRPRFLEIYPFYHYLTFFYLQISVLFHRLCTN